MSTIELKDAPKWIEELGEEIHEAALRGLYSAAIRGVQIIQTQIIPARSPPPVNNGVYRAGWRAEPEEDGAVIFNNEPHAAFIEFGVRGENVKIGAAMIQALTEWVIAKGIAPANEAKSAAFAIATNAKRRGLFNRFGPGLGVLKELEESHLDDLIEAEIKAEIEKVSR